MNNDFLEENNFTYLINFVVNNIKQKTNYNISNNSRYKGILKKLIQTIHTKNVNKNVSKEFLNNLVIDKCIPFIINQLDKDKQKNKIPPTVNILDISSRPKSSKNLKKKSNNFDFSSLELGNNLQNSTPGNNNNNNYNPNLVDNISGMASRNEERVNYSSKLEELQNDRNYQNPQQNPMQNTFENNDPPQLKNSVDDIIGKNSNAEVDNKDLMKKMLELQNERNYNNNVSSQDNFESSKQQNISVQNDFVKDKNNEKLELESDFLQNLYKNQQQPQQQPPPIQQPQITNLQMKVIDTTNELPGIDNNIDNLIEKQNTKDTQENIENLFDNTLLSTNYRFNRFKKKIVCIDISNYLPDIDSNTTTNYDVDPPVTTTSSTKAIDNLSGDYWGNFRVNLREPLILDKITDVYLESIIINNPVQANNYSNLNFAIDIAEFNIKTNTNNTYMFDKFVIPNENTAASGTNKIMKYHLKSNYIASVNPTKLTSLTFNITNEDGETVNANYTLFTNVDSNIAVNHTSTIAITTDDESKIDAGDSVFNIKYEFIGIVTTKAKNNFTIGAGTSILINANDPIYKSSFKTTTVVNNGSHIVRGSTEIATDGGDATSNFSEDSKVYLGNGAFVGKATAVTANKITIGDGTQVYLTDNDILYNGNPLATVFASNSKSNRISMEFVLIGR